MDTSNKFSCFIIGDGTLPIRCAEILIDRKHPVYGIISSDVEVHHWARERGIPSIDPKNKDISTFLSQYPFDYLFSVVNPYIIPKQILDLPRRSAINYHDAPLPRYAGSYATSWAIMQGERVHGVTWHAMTELVDAGDIFQQSLFKIDDGETAFTLNTKCYAAAINSFTELINDVSCDRVSARKQNLNERTFFPRYKRPSPECILFWNRSAYDIGAFVRALDFGPYPNPIGLPKLAIGKDFIIVSEVEVHESLPMVPPGTITHIAPGFIRVSAQDGEIELRKLLTIDGQPLSISDFVTKFELYQGYQFKEIDQEATTRIAAYYASVVPHEAFWQKQLETVEKFTLPYLHRKTPNIQTAGRLQLPMPIPEEITNFLKKHYAIWSIENFLLAAFVAYLVRIGGVWSLDIEYKDTELDSDLTDVEGLFASHIPLHVIIEHRQNFEEIFHTIHEQVKLAKKRKTYSRDIMARYPVLRSKAHSLSVFVERVEALYDYKALHDSGLTLVIQEGGGECLWVYNTEVLNEESVMTMQCGFTTFMEGIITTPQQRISDLPLLTEQQRHQLLVEWNPPSEDFPHDQCIHQLIEAQVERTPQAIAVVCDGQQLTYHELNRRANQLAHLLQARGVEPEVLVGICMQRSLNMLVGLLAILKAGGVYVPLDPDAPPDRLAFLLEDTHMPLLLTHQPLLARFPSSALPSQVFCLDTERQTLSQYSEANPVSEVTAEHLAYVIYTSGSTGQPKGVLIEHHALAAHCQAMVQSFELRAEDRVLQFSAFTFDVSLEQLLPSLLVGARVVMRGQEVWSADELWRAIIELGLTVVNVTPAYMQHVLEEWRQTPQQWQAHQLRLLILGGDRVLPDLLKMWRQMPLQSVRLLNAYGPTETTITATLFDMSQAGEHEPAGEIVPIGRPLPHRTVYLLDASGTPVPVGMTGELHIGGSLLARGYLNRPELTAERFIADPFSQQPHARLYKTGDVARYRADGTIEFLGRMDHQVKLRGFRIELGEIEAVLRQHPAVRDAVVITREDRLGDKQLIAYLVLHMKQAATVADLKSHMIKQVPAYMVPSAFVILEILPLMSNGKIDRRALPAPAHIQSELREDFVAPRTEIEELIAGIWSQIFGIEQIGIYDDFFALGGHSLKAMDVISRLRAALQIELPLHRFFEAPTIAKFSKMIEQVKANEVQLQMSAPQPISREAHRKKLSSIVPTQNSNWSRFEGRRRI